MENQPFVVAVTTLCLLVTVAVAADFSTEPVTPSVPANAVPTAARSDIECAVKCSAAGPADCSASVFLPKSKLCLMSVAKGADFSIEAPRSSVYRRVAPTTTTTSTTTTTATTTATTSGSGNASHWTIGSRRFRVIEHRLNGNVNFARSWTDYENGFGDSTNFWIGLKTIHELTGNAPKLLRVEAVTWSDILSVSEYSGFTVGDASTSYTMTFGSYLSGSSNMSQDCLTYHKGKKFSTMDRDNDLRSGSSCSATFGNGGWWYGGCYYVNPNGIYRTSAVTDTKAMVWKGATSGSHIALKSFRLMIQVA